MLCVKCKKIVTLTGTLNDAEKCFLPFICLVCFHQMFPCLKHYETSWWRKHKPWFCFSSSPGPNGYLSCWSNQFECSSSLQCWEQTTEFLVVSRKVCFNLTKSSHFFCFLLFFAVAFSTERHQMQLNPFLLISNIVASKDYSLVCQFAFSLSYSLNCEFHVMNCTWPRPFPQIRYLSCGFWNVHFFTTWKTQWKLAF